MAIDLLTLITAPAYYPLTLEEAKQHLNVDSDFTDDDQLISSLIVMATETAQASTGRQLIEATYELALSEVPDSDFVYLPKPPLIAVTSIKYTDSNGDEQTLDTDSYSVRTSCHPGYVYFATEPSSLAVADDAIRIRYTTGYGAAEDVPESIRVGIRLLIGEFYRNREMSVMGQVQLLPWGMERLFNQYQVQKFK